MDAFQADKRIRLHEFTKYDMEQYAHDKLEHITNTNTRESLIGGILSRAHGIFLWVALVVKTVREHVENDATEDELATLVSSIPDDLDHLFEHLFLSISKANSKRAFQVFKLLLTARKHGIRLYLYGLSFLEEYEQNKRFPFLETPDRLKKSRREVVAKMAHTRKQLNSWCKGLVDVVYGPEAHTSWYQPYHEYAVEFTHRSIYDFLESNTTMMATDWQRFLRGFDAGDALSQITWATHKSTLTRCPWLFPDRELIAMRWRNGLDKAPFEYLERLAHDDGDGIRMIYNVGKFDDHTIGTVSLRYNMYSFSTVASRRFLAFEEPDICINLANATTCVFGILFHAVQEGHTEYLKWKIENDLSSINDADNAVLLICTFLESTVSLQLSHPTASAAILTLLFENNLASPESMSFWAPGHLSVHPFSETPELANVELSVWHWYLFRVTSRFTAPLLEWGLLTARGPMPPSACANRFMHRLSSQNRAQIGKVLEIFLEHGADPYFMLSVRPEKTVKGGDTFYRFSLNLNLGGRGRAFQ